ncbi:transposase, partial [Vulcanibacillus modesticaldus]|uniref:transposase n=1 Tax=Vulcanibacillus modesticaldus TaxID=337097 RepID=UPI000A9A0259
FVLGTLVTGANVHDSKVLDKIVNQVIEKVEKPSAVVVDAGYKTPYIAKYLSDQDIRPVMPYTRPRTKSGYMRKHEYVYDEYYDCYICPVGEILSYQTTTREGYKQYASNPKICKNCSLLSSCTQSKNYTKMIHRHIWEDYIEEVDHLRHTEENKRLYAKRKETIERVFADMKEKHGLRWTTLRGLKKVSMQAMLVFAAMNLKKLANWTWKRRPNRSQFFISSRILSIFDKNNLMLGNLARG